MARMSKVQETRVRNLEIYMFRYILLLTTTTQRIFNRFTMFGFSLILVASWETILGYILLKIQYNNHLGTLLILNVTI